MKQFLLIASVLFHLLLFAARAGQSEVPSLSATQRAAVVKEANETVNRYLHTGQVELNSLIPNQLCGPTMLALKPLKVVFDRVNLKMIFVDTDEQEAGLYVSIPISSYAVSTAEFAEFVKLSEPEDRTFGSIYRYRIIKKGTLKHPQ